MRKDEFPIVDKVVKDSINKVLDKISAEILALSVEPFHEFDYGYNLGLIGAIKIIDKYKAESEVSDADSN